ncbi:PREDICTED: solute carrier family 26 member 6-like isoform X2 [Vollenhovia emeryi]|uniref:solute carrier family 26 member 6-like isoform X2 n=1 Tax=Vollenhovia emeryi TaxID=411798 RepID=UPI0005F53CCD|nr:PREDICTED: solute carrier family 26 member 6-like isoform X2 [Vollenhovia emeryi]
MAQPIQLEARYTTRYHFRTDRGDHAHTARYGLRPPGKSAAGGRHLHGLLSRLRLLLPRHIQARVHRNFRCGLPNDRQSSNILLEPARGTRVRECLGCRFAGSRGCRACVYAYAGGDGCDADGRNISGIVTTLLSETLVNSFTTAAAVYVLVSQIKDLLGLRLPKQKGYFKLIFTVVDVFRELKNTNIAAAIVSTVSIAILVFNNEFLKPRVSKKCSIPIPIELIAVVGGTLVSRYCDLPKIYNIETVGHIPTGLPKPEVPSFELLPLVLVDSIAITMVSYTITISMALIFAQKLSYDIDSNQELLAMGFSNVMGSFFSCMPISASLSRSLIQQTVGGRTQIASIVSCLLLLIILLWIGPFFELLPRCVLASIIVVALKGMLQQASQLVKFWKLSKADAIIWIVTFLVVILINIDIGLLAGLLVSLVIILLQVIRPYTCLLGHIPHTDLYLDMGRYKAAVEIHGIKIFHYCGTLNFANNSYFKSIVYRLVGVCPRKVIKYRNKLTEEGHFLENLANSKGTCKLQCIIMDMSALSYIDPSSVQVLHVIVDEFTQVNVEFYFVNCPSPIFETIKKCDLYVYGTMPLKIFATIQDAIVYFQNEITSR